MTRRPGHFPQSEVGKVHPGAITDHHAVLAVVASLEIHREAMFDSFEVDARSFVAAMLLKDVPADILEQSDGRVVGVILNSYIPLGHDSLGVGKRLSVRARIVGRGRGAFISALHHRMIRTSADEDADAVVAVAFYRVPFEIKDRVIGLNLDAIRTAGLTGGEIFRHRVGVRSCDHAAASLDYKRAGSYGRCLRRRCAESHKRGRDCRGESHPRKAAHFQFSGQS